MFQFQGTRVYWLMIGPENGDADCSKFSIKRLQPNIEMSLITSFSYAKLHISITILV